MKLWNEIQEKIEETRLEELRLMSVRQAKGAELLCLS